MESEEIEKGLTQLGHGDNFNGDDLPESFARYRAWATQRDNKAVQIIDGQQRLTGLCILSRFLEKHPRTTDEQKKKLQTVYKSSICGTNRINHPLAPSLRAFSRVLTFDPANNTEEEEDGTAKPDNADNTTDDGFDLLAKESFKDALDTVIDWFDDKEGDYVKKYTTWFLEKVKITAEGTNFKEQSYLIFRSLNSLGKGLTSSEKIKNDLLFHASKCNSLQAVETQWNNILDELDNLALDGKVSMDVSVLT